jgi:hypothetical protein
MSDDYQYRSRSVPQDDQGPFGYGRVLPFGFNSFVPSNGESGAPDGGSGAPTGAPGDTGGGGTTPGSGGSLPAGTEGALLRHNGSSWVSIVPPSGEKDSIFANSTGDYNYIQGNQAGGIVYFDGLKWDYLDGSTTGNRALILRGGEPEWIDSPASGTHVLGSIGGEIQWIETESCDT